MPLNGFQRQHDAGFGIGIYRIGDTAVQLTGLHSFFGFINKTLPQKRFCLLSCRLRRARQLPPRPLHRCSKKSLLVSGFDVQEVSGNIVGGIPVPT